MSTPLLPAEDAESRFTALADLAARTRELMDAVVLTEVPEEDLSAIAGELAALTERLGVLRRDIPLRFELGPDGVPRHFGNAVSGNCNPHALPLVVELDPEGGVRADIDFRPLHVGPPGGVHGGVTAMILDQLLGTCAAVSGVGGVTGTLSVRYVRPVPYDRPVVGTARVARTEGRKTWVDGRISLPDGTTLVESTGLFITPAAWRVS